MPKSLKLVAQQVEDQYYQNYKADVDFFDLNDFILYTGNTISAIYNAYYQEKYKELLSEKKDEVVQFDAGMLSEQILEVKSNVAGILFAKYKHPIMSFLYDNQTTGIQDIFSIKPAGNNEFERTNISEKWSLKYMPVTNRIFFYGEIEGVAFVNKGVCNVDTVRVLYVPSMYPDALIPDAIIDMAIQKTIMSMKQAADKNVIKETLDQNKNKVLELESNKKQGE